MDLLTSKTKLSEILKEATQDESSVCYVTEDDADTIKTAISAIEKIEKIKEIIKSPKGYDYEKLIDIQDLLKDL